MKKRRQDDTTRLHNCQLTARCNYLIYKILDFLKSRENFIARLLHHMDTSAIMDLLLRLVMSMESPECKAACLSVSF